jgi:hypothetical protein
MTRSTFALLSCLTLMFFSAACSKTDSSSAPAPPSTPAASPSAKRITSESVVKTIVQRVEIPAGSSAEATVRITIDDGYHVNANPPTFPYLKATTLELKPAEGISIGPVVYPKATEKKFPFADKPLAVYEGDAELKTTLKIEKTAKKGERSIPASLRIQACDNQVCYPPGTVELAIPVTIN